MDVRFQTETEKEVFIARLSCVRNLLSSKEGEKVENYELLSQFFPLADVRPLFQHSQGPVLLRIWLDHLTFRSDLKVRCVIYAAHAEIRCAQ